jgi:hypothetical protein
MKAFNVLRSIPFLVLTSAACSSILGIEDIHEGEEPGGEGGENANGGSGGARGGSGGSSGTSGSSGDAGSSGASTTGGASGNSTGGASGDAGGGGEGDTGGSDSGGSSNGGSAGSGGMPDPTVRGKLVTTWKQPIPATTIFLTHPETGEPIGQADTGTDGTFEIEDVPDAYDAKFVINYQVNNPSDIRTFGWVYLGLTRRDPTLQVYNGLNYQSGYYSAYVTDLPAMPLDNLRCALGIGGPYGNTSTSISLPNGIGQSSSGWQGPDTHQISAHALLMELDENDIPTAYYAVDQHNAVLSTVPADLTFSLASDTIPSGIIGGDVISATSSDRTNYVHLRYETNATIELVEQYGADLNPASFSYRIPTITGASVEIAAVEGTPSFGAAACAHRDRLAPQDEDVVIEIPTPPIQVSPTSGITNVDGSTMFSWTSTAETFVLFLNNIEPTSPFGGMYIVTAEKQASIPEFPNGFTLIPGDLYNWRVETHRSWATVNEMAGPDGFADSWAPYCEAPETPLRGDGQFAISAGRTFTMAP